MIPFSLRRFGAALVCSLALGAADSPLALATDANVDGAPANSDPAAPRSRTAGDSGSPANGKSSDAAKPAAPAGTDARKDSGSAAKATPGVDAAKSAPGSDTAKPGADAAKPGAVAAKSAPGTDSAKPAPGTDLPKTSLEAKAEAEKEGRRHGARSKAADGTLLVWDNVNFVWIAAEAKNTYWVDDRYFRYDEGIWLESKLIKGPWQLTASHLVPEAPRGRHGDPKESVTATLPSGLEAIYEPRIRAFRIAGRKGVFLFEGSFYRYDGGVWLESKSVDGPWTHTSSVGLPAALRRALAPAEKGARVTLPTGEVLVSEGQPGLFAVESRPDALYFDGTFYERRDQKWFKSASAASGWEEISSQKIPGTVRSNYHKGPDDKGAGKKGAKGKGADRKKAAARGGKAAE